MTAHTDHPLRLESVAIPKGWKLVPVEPTDAMVRDGGEAVIGYYADFVATSSNPKDQNTMRQAYVDASRAYRAMLAAAPSPTADERQGK